ncbi:non-ribosomal peptide synthetase/type I polyketide synthase [Paenibacillus elgii]|uniref:non-ribosomal peptide synthetase/type I polyketide synthase n=1 Tax=Paenibacillus elgii TaxID=189691 RepID=UPI0013D41F7A|nr:non-ribosomal peptide synthetase/type I polyketide synthase [Paenibacillus elgii]NEN81344.1 amino acid adenylation domain-containing protein [Paenibacillus elgii]
MERSTDEKRLRLARLLQERETQPRQYPLSLPQQRLWFLEQMAPGNTAYLITTAIRMEGAFDREVFAKCMRHLVRRHESLRTRFRNENGKAVQHVDPPADIVSFPLPETDLSSWAPKEKEAELSRLLLAETDKPFDIARDRLVRAHWVLLDQEEGVLLLTLHHLISDGWTLGLLIREIETCYRAYVRGEAPKLAPLPFTYGEYAQHQREALDGDAFKRRLSYWTEKLRNSPSLLALPTDRPRPAVQSTSGAMVPLKLPREVSEKLKGLARERGASVFMTALSGFYALLARYTGQEDIVLGCPSANRNESGTAGVVGLFVNPVALRVRVSGELSFRSLLSQVKDTMVEALAHQDVPFERIVEELQPQRSLDASPLFQVMAVQTVPASLPDLPGLRLSPVGMQGTSAKFDMTLYVEETESELSVVLEYRKDLFDAETAERLLERYRVLLAAAAADPLRPIGTLPLLTLEEERQALEDWHRPLTAAEDEEVSLLELFDRQVQSGEDRIALIEDGRRVSYGMLNRMANRIAWELLSAGVAPEVFVGVCMERGIERTAALLGILKAGGAYVPLDPGYPADRMRLILQETGAPLVVTQSFLAAKVPTGDYRLLTADSLGELPERYDHNPPAPDIHGDSAAYVIFTSGSTGAPKGVVGLHRGILNRLRWGWETYPYAEDEVCCHQAALTFVDAVAETFGPLLRGVPAVILPQMALQDPEVLVDALAKHRISRIVMVPSLLRVVLEACARRKEFLERLRYWSVSGEALPQALCERFFELLPGRTLINIYGSSEVAADATYHAMTSSPQGAGVPIGRPLRNMRVCLVDERLQLVPPGVAGEICVGGAGLARGYLHRPDWTAERFIDDPFSAGPGERLYRTGDIGRRLPDGTLLFEGRRDQQIKIRGMRVELSEIESVLIRHPAVRNAVVAAAEKNGKAERLVAYVVQEDEPWDPAGLRGYLREHLPEHMVPALFVPLEALPLTATGKIDRRALPAWTEASASASPGFVPPATDMERRISSVWRQALQTDRVGLHDNFFDLGGHSLLLIEVRDRLSLELSRELSVVELFQYPTVAELASHLAGQSAGSSSRRARKRSSASAEYSGPPNDAADIAIIGMSGRFPGADGIEAFWTNLLQSECGIRSFSKEELENAGVPARMREDRHFVNCGGTVEGIELFDAAFFGYTPGEAEMLDPQHRVFLECAWEALERAGYAPGSSEGAVGVYAGTTQSTYLLCSLLPRLDPADPAGMFAASTANQESYLATRVAYKLDLHGPGVTVQTACSTSLVAVHTAAQALLAGECDMALAGGVTIKVPQTTGYVYREGSIVSADGSCKAFDAEADGTVFANGAGVVVLKRLDEALRDGDTVHAVIKGSAINNDGGRKVGYTAPSVGGQAEVIRMALDAAGVGAESISYVEAHGTGTPLGDPIELAALTEVFGPFADGPLCGIGSVKTNVGHLDAAAGIASLIKVALSMRSGLLPASLYYTKGNPAVDWANSPFYVVDRARPWNGGSPGQPRRAGVSSFGIGGTNAHVIVEEAPAQRASDAASAEEVLVLSARTPSALQAMRERLAAHLEADPSAKLSDVAFTLQQGRKAFGHRWSAVCSSAEQALSALRGEDARAVRTGLADAGERPVVFAFPGQGSQYAGMGAELYEQEPVYRETVDRCAELLMPHLGMDVRDALLGREGFEAERLEETWLTQPALFVAEYALARLWMSVGVKPAALIGHSLGEYTAACLAGVFSLEEGLELVSVRGRLMHQCEAGAMAAVGANTAELTEQLKGTLEIAAVNGPKMSVVTGAAEEVEELMARLQSAGVECRRLRTGGAFHSSRMEPALGELEAALQRVKLSAPRIPYVSNETGEWITAEQAGSAAYWVSHARHTVKFAENAECVLERYPNAVVIEVGPGQTLTSLMRQSVRWGAEHRGVRTLPPGRTGAGERRQWLESVAELWSGGQSIAWKALHGSRVRNRVELPTYPFERQRYWIEPRLTSAAASAVRGRGLERLEPEQWLYEPMFRPTTSISTWHPKERSGLWVVFEEERGGWMDVLAERLEHANQPVVRIREAAGFERLSERLYGLNPARPEQYALLFDALAVGEGPTRVLCSCCSWTQEDSSFGGVTSFLQLSRALQAHAGAAGNSAHLCVVTEGLYNIAGETDVRPERMMVAGLGQVWMQEHALSAFHLADALMPNRRSQAAAMADAILEDFMSAPAGSPRIYRGNQRWMREYEPVHANRQDADNEIAHTAGTYLLIGPFDRKMQAFAQYLVQPSPDPGLKRIVIINEQPVMPDKAVWPAIANGEIPAGDKARQAAAHALRLEELGAEVHFIPIASPKQRALTEAVDQAAALFGELTGVLYADWSSEEMTFAAASELDGQAVEAELDRTAQGLDELERALAPYRPEFCFIQSSIASELGGLGLSLHAAAAAYTEAFVRRHNELTDSRWRCIQWDAWTSGPVSSDREGRVSELARLAIRPEEGVRLWTKLMACGNSSHCLVSTADFAARRAYALQSHSRQAEQAGPDKGNLALRPRPALPVPLVAPRHDMEQQLADAWSELLGMEPIGIHDDFFNLGGHSLLATQVISWVNSRFPIEFPLKLFFEHPTVAEVAEAIEALLIEKLESMTDEQVSELL